MVWHKLLKASTDHGNCYYGDGKLGRYFLIWVRLNDDYGKLAGKWVRACYLLPDNGDDPCIVGMGNFLSEVKAFAEFYERGDFS